MLDPAAVVRAVAKALKPGGRFVAEMGGKGNIKTIVSAIHRVVLKYHPFRHRASTIHQSANTAAFSKPTAWKSAELSSLIGQPHLKVNPAWSTGSSSSRAYYFEGLPATAIAEVVSDLRPLLHTSNGWHADYRRLRFVAVKS